MTYQYYKAIDAIAEKITLDKPTHKNMGFVQLHGTAISLRNSIEALGTLYSHPNPLETSDAHIKRVAKAAGQLSEKVTQTNEAIIRISQQGLKEIDERIRQKVNLEPNGYAPEIRQAFRAMKPAEQIKLLHQLADENRGAELGAIVNAPALLTGIKPELQTKYTDYIISKHAPEEYQEKKAFADSIETAFIAADVGKTVVAEYSDSAKLTEIEKKEAASNQANFEFSNSLINA